MKAVRIVRSFVRYVRAYIVWGATFVLLSVLNVALKDPVYTIETRKHPEITLE